MFLNKLKGLICKISAKVINSNDSKIIFYHDISTKYTDMGTPVPLFEEQIMLLKDGGYDIVRKIKQEKKQIQINFDDGFRGIYDHQEFFLKNNIFPTVFLAISLIGQEGYLTKDEILELQGKGFIFESHGWSHSNLTEFSDKDLKFELEESKKYLENLLMKEVKEICFPIGYFSKRVLKACDNAGYNVMYSSLPGNFFNKRKDGLLYRNLVQFSESSEFKAILKGGMDLFFIVYKKRHFLDKDAHKIF